MKRKYLPIDKYPVYNKFYTKYQLESHILNSGSESIPSIDTVLWDRQNTQSQLICLVGDQQGNYFVEGNEQIAIIPFVKNRIEDQFQRFKAYQLNRVNSGYEKPTEMPKEIQNEVYRLEAQLSIYEAERELLEAQLKKFAEQTVKDDSDSLLRYGLKCAGKCHGTGAKDPKMVDVLQVMDGQNLSMHPDGFLIIDDARSPYDGMSLPDYRKLSKQWITDRYKADEELLIKMQAEARLSGEPRPIRTGMNLGSTINRANLPKFPEWAVNHKAVKEVAEPIQRKKKLA